LIIDSSALIAITLGEPGWEELRHAINSTPSSMIPAPVLTETRLVAAARGGHFLERLEIMLKTFLEDGVGVVSFTEQHAHITAAARTAYGKGNGQGGKLNFGDLMVYAVAKASSFPLLCTGNDFISTDLVLHPASRPESRVDP
jgi:ribonuclease VapC